MDTFEQKHAYVRTLIHNTDIPKRSNKYKGLVILHLLSVRFTIVYYSNDAGVF